MGLLSFVGACDRIGTPAQLQAAAGDCPASPPLQLGTQPVFVAMNAYYLQEEAARSIRSGQTQSAFVEEVFSKAVALGVTVIRTNGFNDDPAKAGDSAIQIAKLQYDETSFRGLDLVLTSAQAHGLKLILPLGNSWDDYGGQRQYVAWNGLPNPAEQDPRFFTDTAVMAHYSQHLTNVLNRMNTFDGIRYGDHPAVLAWELINEPRLKGLDGAVLRGWIDTMGALVKSLSPDHSVGVGEEGFDTTTAGYDSSFWRQAASESPFSGTGNFTDDTASSSVDYGSVHLYPESYGWSDADAAAAGAKWISEHAAIARSLGKSLLVGEFGLRNDGSFTLDERRAMYSGWFSCAQRTGAGGIAPWLFAYDARPDSWDPYTFYFHTGTQPSDPVNRYADLVQQAATNVR